MIRFWWNLACLKVHNLMDTLVQFSSKSDACSRRYLRPKFESDPILQNCVQSSKYKSGSCDWIPAILGLLEASSHDEHAHINFILVWYSDQKLALHIHFQFFWSKHRKITAQMSFYIPWALIHVWLTAFSFHNTILVFHNTFLVKHVCVSKIRQKI